MEKLRSGMSQEQITKLRRFQEMVLEKNKVMNLTALTSEKQFYHKHFEDSLKLLDYRQLQGKILDLGTGAGFPGIPLAILCPEVEFLLLDSLQKRINFLHEVVEELALPNVTLLHARAEDAARTELRGSFDAVVTRALAALPVLLEITIPFLKKGGSLYAYKGEKVQEELDQSTKALRALGAEVEKLHSYSIMGDAHCILEVKKVHNTAPSYPRKPHQIAKKPL